MYSGLFSLLFTPNFISIPLWFIVIIFLVPYRPLFGLCLWLFLAFWTLFYFPISRPYVDRGVVDDLGEAIIYLIAFPIAIGILVWVIFIIANIFKSDRHLEDREELPELILINKIILFMYGVLFGVWTFLFFADFLERYHPAWEAYIIVALFSLLFPVLFNFLEKYIKAKRYIREQQIPWFIYSFWAAIMSLLVISFSFASTAMIQTKKTIERYAGLDTKYCIQYMNIDTWLDLTPLTTWNKSSGDWGAAKNHAILVVKTPNSPAHLYNWSYKSKKWEYITTGFKPGASASPSSLECNLEKDFVVKIPFIIPQTNSFYVGKQKIKIPPEYFPQQEEYSFNSVISGSENRKNIKAIKFLASIPNFSKTRQIFAKLPNIYNFSTDISIYPLINKKYFTLVH